MKKYLEPKILKMYTKTRKCLKLKTFFKILKNRKFVNKIFKNSNITDDKELLMNFIVTIKER